MAHKILVTDDEPNIVRLIQIHLERRGYLVVTASNGQEALEKIHSERPDAVILDIRMPVVDGLEVLQQSRLNPDLAQLRFIIISEPIVYEEISDGIRAGDYKYLCKPFLPGELMDMVDELFVA